MKHTILIIDKCLSDQSESFGKKFSMDPRYLNNLDTTMTNAATSEDPLKSKDFGDNYRKGMITPINPGFDPQPNAIYTPYSVAKFLGVSETEARAYFRILNIPKLAGCGYLGSDIIGATEELRNGSLTVKPAKRGRQEIQISYEPKYKRQPLDTPQQGKDSSLSEFKKSLNCKSASSKTRSSGAVISVHPTPKEDDK